MPGHVALVSQSGGILGSLLSRAQAAGIGFSKLIATGNECDLEVADFIDHLVDDPATRVIALYLEGLRNPQAFKAAVTRARAAGKPVVAFKVGRSEAGARSAVSHTGALAGSDAAYDALFRQFGVIRAERYSDLLDIPLALGSRPHAQRQARRHHHVDRRRGQPACRCGGTRRLRHAAARRGDRGEAQGARNRGRDLDRNPIDVTLAGVKSDTFRTVLDAVAESPTLRRRRGRARLVGAARAGDRRRGRLRDCAARSDKPIVGFVSPDAPQLVRQLNLAGVPTFAAPESCAVGALGAAAQRRDRRLTMPTSVPPAPVLDDELRALLKPGSLNEADSKRLFARFGIPVTREVVAATAGKKPKPPP